MLCFCCDIKLHAGAAKYVVYGKRTMVVHIACARRDLVTYAAELGVFPVDDPNRTDQQLIDAIVAEKLAGEWLDKMEELPDDAKRDAVHRLRLDLEETAKKRES